MTFIWLFLFMNWSNVFWQTQLFGETFFTRWALVGSISFMNNMVIWKIKFYKERIYKLGRFLAKNERTQTSKKMIVFCVTKCLKIRLDLQSKFSLPRIHKVFPRISYLYTYINLGAYFLLLTSFDNFNFWNTLTTIMNYQFPLGMWIFGLKMLHFVYSFETWQPILP